MADFSILGRLALAKAFERVGIIAGIAANRSDDWGEKDDDIGRL
jgi:hypothetical protein